VCMVVNIGLVVCCFVTNLSFNSSVLSYFTMTSLLSLDRLTEIGRTARNNVKEVTTADWCVIYTADADITVSSGRRLAYAKSFPYKIARMGDIKATKFKISR